MCRIGPANAAARPLDGFVASQFDRPAGRVPTISRSAGTARGASAAPGAVRRRRRSSRSRRHRRHGSCATLRWSRCFACARASSSSESQWRRREFSAGATTRTLASSRADRSITSSSVPASARLVGEDEDRGGVGGGVHRRLPSRVRLPSTLRPVAVSRLGTVCELSRNLTARQVLTKSHEARTDFGRDC